MLRETMSDGGDNDRGSGPDEGTRDAENDDNRMAGDEDGGGTTELVAEEANSGEDMSIDDEEGVDTEQNSREVVDLTGSTSTEEEEAQYTSPAYYDLTISRPDTNPSDTSVGTQPQASDAESEPSTASTHRIHSATSTTDTIGTDTSSNPTDRRAPRTNRPKPADKGHTFTTDSTTIPSSWILLDSCSTINIRWSKKRMKIARQSRTSTTNLVGDLDEFPEPLWFTPDGIANVLSLASVRKYFEVKYRVEGSSAIFMVKMPSREITFKESPDGLYYHDFGRGGKETSLVTTVRDQRE